MELKFRKKPSKMPSFINDNTNNSSFAKDNQPANGWTTALLGLKSTLISFFFD